MGNLRVKKGKFTSRKQLANGESISCSCCFPFYIMIDILVNFDFAKTIIVTFVLKIINSKSVFKTTFTRGGFIRVKATFHSTIFDIPMRLVREDQRHRRRFTR